METRVAILSIIVEEHESVEKLNHLLHQYRDGIIGRMGIPYKDKGISVISVVLDATVNEINALTGAVGKLPGVTAKATYSKTK